MEKTGISKKKIIIIAVAAVVVIGGIIVAVLLQNPLNTKKDTFEVEFGQPISTDAATYLKKDVDKDIVKNTKVTYKADPVEGQEYDNIGDYKVTLKYETKKKEVTVSVKDTTKPEFNATAEAGIETIEGVELNFAELITATDLSGAEVTFKNADEIDLNKAGEYVLKATAKDKAGNTAKKDIKITVAEKPANMTGSSVTVDPSTGKVTVQAKTSSSSYGGSANGSAGSSGGSSSGSSGSSGGNSIEGNMHYGGYINGESGNTWYYSDEFTWPSEWE